MDGNIEYSSEKRKTTKKRKLIISFAKKDFLLVLILPSLVYLFTSDNFLKFVVEIVKLLLNRSFYYFGNNRIFVFIGGNMELDKIIEEKIEASRLYGVSKPLIIKEILKIPDYINIKRVDKIIDTYYDTFYIKKEWVKDKETREQRHEKFLNIEKCQSQRFAQIPDGEDKTKYRKIVVLNQDWLKKSQKKFNKILMDIILTKKIRNEKPYGIIPYLHSSVKQKSYVTNAQVHVGDKYVFAIDLKDFYPSVTKQKIYNFFKNKFKLPSDIAMFYAVISTCKSEEGIYRLGQGLSQSSTLAYLVNYSLFNYLYKESFGIGIDMSIYVDDVIFSSENKIPQNFIDRIFGLARKNDMEVKREKVHNYKNDSTKKVTGVYIKGNKTRVANKKHEEFHIQYKYLQKNIVNVKSLDEYFKIYNLYLKFYGNFQHIKMVEGRVHDRYINFINKYDVFFPKGINKKQRHENYKRGNIKTTTENHKINSCYQQLLRKNCLPVSKMI